MSYDPFENRHKFQDDVWGQIRLNDLERDVIDTPEFQRLFRTSLFIRDGNVWHMRCRDPRVSVEF
jgi:hypothetical protein